MAVASAAAVALFFAASRDGVRAKGAPMLRVVHADGSVSSTVHVGEEVTLAMSPARGCAYVVARDANEGHNKLFPRGTEACAQVPSDGALATLRVTPGDVELVATFPETSTPRATLRLNVVP